jgi:P-type Ca2+ transporter type 2C
LAAACLCTDVLVRRKPLEIVGEATETSLVEAAARDGFWKDELERELPRVAEVPFDSARKRMTTVHRVDSRDHLGTLGSAYVAFTKRAVESLLGVTSATALGNDVVPLTPTVRARITDAGIALAGEGARVLGLAYRELNQATPEDVEDDLVFLGMVGLVDPPREDARPAVAACLSAGIRPVMITGDHPLTAPARAASKKRARGSRPGSPLAGPDC